ncbi:glycosyl hydrolase [Coprinopsis sp. MPI-PUGE-AT-0042]|nr:glycosyl hydrolase [Coprinopsis sp. MPI-PUGE-AT-0042]
MSLLRLQPVDKDATSTCPSIQCNPSDDTSFHKDCARPFAVLADLGFRSDIFVSLPIEARPASLQQWSRPTSVKKMLTQTFPFIHRGPTRTAYPTSASLHHPLPEKANEALPGPHMILEQLRRTLMVNRFQYRAAYKPLGLALDKPDDDDLVEHPIARATTIAGLKTASPKVVWQDTNTASRCCNLWAPEIHWQSKEGSWYIYYSAGTAGTFDNQRMHVLKGSSTNIWNSSWSYAGLSWSLGRHDTGFIRVWDGADQCLWIAKMNSATTVGNAVKISTPTYAWERVTANVNEGAAILYGGGRTLLIYSASNCAGTGYKTGHAPSSGRALTLSILARGPSRANQSSRVRMGAIYQDLGIMDSSLVHPETKLGWSTTPIRVTPGTCDGNRYTAIQRVNWSG